MNLVERKQSDDTIVYYIEHELKAPEVATETSDAVVGTYLMIECTTKQQAITILKQIHAANDIYVEERNA